VDACDPQLDDSPAVHVYIKTLVFDLTVEQIATPLSAKLVQNFDTRTAISICNMSNPLQTEPIAIIGVGEYSSSN